MSIDLNKKYALTGSQLNKLKTYIDNSGGEEVDWNGAIRNSSANPIVGQPFLNQRAELFIGMDGVTVPTITQKQQYSATFKGYSTMSSEWIEAVEAEIGRQVVEDSYPTYFECSAMLDYQKVGSEIESFLGIAKGTDISRRVQSRSSEPKWEGLVGMSLQSDVKKFTADNGKTVYLLLSSWYCILFVEGTNAYTKNRARTWYCQIWFSENYFMQSTITFGLRLGLSGGYLSSSFNGFPIAGSALPDAQLWAKGGVKYGDLASNMILGDYLMSYNKSDGTTMLDLKHANIVDWESNDSSNPSFIGNKPFGIIAKAGDSTTAVLDQSFYYDSREYERIMSLSNESDVAIGLTQEIIDDAGGTIRIGGEPFVLTTADAVAFFKAAAEWIDAGGNPQIQINARFTDNMEGAYHNGTTTRDGFVKNEYGYYVSTDAYIPRDYSRYFYRGIAFKVNEASVNIYLGFEDKDPHDESYYEWWMGCAQYARVAFTGTATVQTTVTKQIAAEYVPLDENIFQIVNGEISIPGLEAALNTINNGAGE